MTGVWIPTLYVLAFLMLSLRCERRKQIHHAARGFQRNLPAPSDTYVLLGGREMSPKGFFFFFLWPTPLCV